MHVSSLISYLYLTNHAPQSPIAEIKSETGAPSASATLSAVQFSAGLGTLYLNLNPHLWVRSRPCQT